MNEFTVSMKTMVWRRDRVGSIRLIAGTAIVGALALAGCSGPALTARAPGQLLGTTGTQVRIIDPAPLAHTRRPSHVFQASVDRVTDDAIEISTTLTAEDLGFTTMTAWYLDLRDDRGHSASEPDILAESDPRDRPRPFTYQYSETVLDAEIHNSSGDVVGEVTHDEDRTGVALEHYYTRRQRLRFARNGLLTEGATKLSLDVRDAGFTMHVEWQQGSMLQSGGGGYGQQQGYGPPPPPPPPPPQQAPMRRGPYYRGY